MTRICEFRAGCIDQVKPTILRPTGRAARSSIGSFTGPSPEAHNPSRGTTHSDVSA